jgi:hypothetical protein
VDAPTASALLASVHPVRSGCAVCHASFPSAACWKRSRLLQVIVTRRTSLVRTTLRSVIVPPVIKRACRMDRVGRLATSAFPWGSRHLRHSVRFLAPYPMMSSPRENRSLAALRQSPLVALPRVCGGSRCPMAMGCRAASAASVRPRTTPGACGAQLAPRRLAKQQAHLPTQLASSVDI